jgi:hypothetical protein
MSFALAAEKNNIVWRGLVYWFIGLLVISD